jgi:hypothetical protein
MLFFPRLDWHEQYHIRSKSSYTTWLCSCVSNFDRLHPALLISPNPFSSHRGCSYYPLYHHPYPPFSQTSEGLFWSCIEAHPRSKVPSPWKDVIPQPWKSDKRITSTSVTFLPKEELNGRLIDSSAPTSLISYLRDRGIPCNHVSLLITSPPS